MSTNISFGDKQVLLNLIMNAPLLDDRNGLIALLVAAGLDDLRHQITLEGPKATYVPLVLDYLIRYGRVSYEHAALGRFLNALKTHVGITSRKQIDNIIQKYSLMIPAATCDIASWDDLPKEKIIGENTLRPVAFLVSALNAARSVAYMEVQSGSESWSATAFLLSEDLLITNHHVLPERKLLHTTTIRFNYELDTNGNELPVDDYTANGSGFFQANEELDYAVLEVDGAPGRKWGWLHVADYVPSLGTRINIIQHPHGQPKQLSFQNNHVLHSSPSKIRYITSTNPGSSGSPVFADDWRVVGIHHAGGLLPSDSSSQFEYRNEAIGFHSILEDLPSQIVERITLVSSE